MARLPTQKIRELERRFDEVDGADRVHFCGAWWGYGFHEDGMVSGLRVCHRIGVDWHRSTLEQDR